MKSSCPKIKKNGIVGVKNILLKLKQPNCPSHSIPHHLNFRNRTRRQHLKCFLISAKMKFFGLNCCQRCGTLYQNFFNKVLSKECIFEQVMKHIIQRLRYQMRHLSGNRVSKTIIYSSGS